MKSTIMGYLDELCAEFDKVDWSDRKIYAAYCAQVYYYSRHTTRIIALGAGRMSLEDQAGHVRFTKHVQEEMNHEILSVRDCEALGFKVEDFPELPATTAFYQTQYYMAMAITPWAFLGYALILEGVATEKAIELWKVVTAKHGAKCGSFLKVHGEEDEDHFPLAVKMVEQRSAFERNAIMESAKMSLYFHCALLRDLPLAVAGMSFRKKQAA